jgi:Tol biopolymer transport system component
VADELGDTQGLVAGRTLLQYEILGPIGQGGMGQVFRARDLRLGREVALKMLPPELAGDAERVQRFEREARAASALNHPHIVALFDTAVVGEQRVIVMELVEGRPLDLWVRETQPGLGEVLDVLTQLADALAAAHDVGVIHRDVKPANVLVTRQAYVKVLDFGLAKVAPAGGAAEATASLTRTGFVMGTLAYMSPEQALGRPTDARSDVFAVGAVLYEAVAGQPAFQGKTQVDVLHAIVNLAPPPLTARRPDAPAALQWVVDKALAKSPEERHQSMHELSADLRRLRRSLGSQPTTAVPATARGSVAMPWVAAAIAALAGLAVGGSIVGRGTEQSVSPAAQAAAPVFQVTTLAPAALRAIGPVIAPDGKWVAYVGTPDPARSDVYVQFIGGGPAVNLTRGVDLNIQNRTIIAGLGMAPDGAGIAFGLRPLRNKTFQTGGVYVVPAPVGGPVRLATEGFAALRWSPDGKRVALVRADPVAGDALVVADEDGQNAREVVPTSGSLHLHHPAWSHDGQYIYFTRGVQVHTAPGLEVWRVRATGGPTEPVVATQGVAMQPAPTADGRALVYAGDPDGRGLNLYWRMLDGSGEWRLTTGAGEYLEPHVSRDGRRIAAVGRRLHRELAAVEVEGPTATRVLTLGGPGSSDGEPSVSRASGRIFVSSYRAGGRNIWSVDAQGGDPRPITSSGYVDQGPQVSPDGRQVAFVSDRGGRRGIWVIPAEGGTPRSLATVEVLDRVSWSSDGRRLAFARSDPQEPTLWSMATEGGAPVRIAGAAGRVPIWSPTRDELAYARGDASGQTALHFVSLDGQPTRPPAAIAEVGLPSSAAWSPDGRRIALVNLPGRGEPDVWVLTLATGRVQRVAALIDAEAVEGVAWSADSRRVVFGYARQDTEVLLLQRTD